MIIDYYFQFIIVLFVVLYHIVRIIQVTTTNNTVVLSIKDSFNVISSTIIVGMCNHDEDISNVSFSLENNNQQICFLNNVSPPLKHWTGETCIVFYQSSW